MKLEQIVPWGRSRAEYELMFDMSVNDLRKRILGCGDGPASFNAEMNADGYQVISIDPIYEFDADAIRARVAATYESIISQVEKNLSLYRWNYFRTPEELGKARLAAMNRFLDDYDEGRSQGRYLPDALPSLRFEDKHFDLALCSHLLFLYSEQLSLDFHLAAIQELLRVAHEVRIFPLLALDCQPSTHLGEVQAHFAAQGFKVEVRQVPYEFQVGGDQMLCIGG